MIPRENQRGRSWIYPILTLLLASATALAGTTGNLTGYVTGPNNAPLAGVKVTVTSPMMQGSRSTTTDAQGFFRLTQLPPGDNYRARFEVSGYKVTERAGVVIHIDETIKLPTIRLQTQQEIAAIEVVEEAPVVEQGTTSVGRTLTNDFLSAVPTGRNTVAILQLAPGAATDAIGTTFRGASSPENNYVVDGLNTTGILNGLDSSSLPPEFIQEIQVKTGGYEPEYGRATGGQSIVITKSGGNEFHGDVFAYITPIEGRRHTIVAGDNTGTSEDGKAGSLYNLHQSLLAQVGFDLGGYIIKDRLWFFAGYAPEYRKRIYSHEFRLLGEEDPATVGDPAISSNAVQDEQTRLTNFYIVNFTFNINQDHSLRLSASGNPAHTSGVDNTFFYGDPGVYMGSNDYAAQDYSLLYNGKFFGGLVNLDTTIGYHTENDWDTPFDGTYNSLSGNSAFEGQEITGSGNEFQYRWYYPVPGGCNSADGASTADCNFNFYLGGGYGAMNRTAADRFVVKPVLSVFVNNFVGNHVFKLGGDFERNHVLNRRAYTGGSFVDVYRRTDSSTGEYYYLYRERYYSNFGEPVTWNGLEDLDSSYYKAETFTLNTSAFIQDSWSILSNLSLSLGIRWERQQLKDTQGITRIDLKDNIAPRLGVIFDFTKEGKSKLFANFGRYYESIPQDINDRALSAEGFNYYRYDSREFGELGSGYTPGAQPLTDDYLLAFLGGEVSPIQANLKGQYSDQFLVGFEYEVMKNLSAGVTGVYATLGNVIEDISPDNGNTYIVANPGADNFNYYVADVDENGNLSEPHLATVDPEDPNSEAVVFRQCIAANDPLTGAPVTYCFPKATRVYRGLEFSLNKRFSDNWTAQASYTLSQTFGNYPGLFAQSRGQLDPNITSQFDLPNLLANRVGYLDTDRRHLLKFAGAYQFNFGTSLGLTANIQSGIPVNYLGAHAVYGNNEAFIIPRGVYPTDAPAEGESTYVPARTPWVFALDASVHHELTFANKKKLSLGLQVNNILNAQSYLRLSQTYTRDVSNPAVGGNSLSQVQCYDTLYYTPKAQCERSNTFGNPIEYQAPFSVRFEAKFSF